MDLVWKIEQLKKHASKLHIREPLTEFHKYFRLMATGRYDFANIPWLDAHNLLAIAKFIVLYGKTGPITKRPRLKDYDCARLINPFGELWTKAEEAFEYPDDPLAIGLFLIRLIYQQSPFQ